MPISTDQPAKNIGIGFLIGFAASDALVCFRMKEIGYKWISLRGGTFDYGEYLRIRSKYGWPAWPVYLLWAMLIIGLVLFVLGSGIRYGLHPQ